MNSTELINLNLTLNSTKNDFFNGIYYVPVELFGVLTNLINIIIFSNKTFKDKTFTYLLYHSISECTYLLLAYVTLISHCGNYCTYLFTKSLFIQLVKVYIDYYFTSCLAIFAIMLEITISLQRYLIVSNSTFCGLIKNGCPHKICLVLFIVSLFYYLPVLIFYRVVLLTTSPDVYKPVLINDIYSYFSYTAIIVRGPICTLILTIINFSTLIKFRNQMKRKAVIKCDASNNIKSNTNL
jgi:hypothetical protein